MNKEVIQQFFNEKNTTKNTSVFGSFITTPIGEMLCLSEEKGIIFLGFLDQKAITKQLASLKNVYLENWNFQKNKHILKLELELEAYFSKQSTQFQTPIVFHGTVFQRAVWEALKMIDYGKTIAYKEEASMMKMPTKVRAVAQANAQNKLSIIVPCHRVISSSGKLSGYAGGVWRKSYLLNLEQNDGNK